MTDAPSLTAFEDAVALHYPGLVRRLTVVVGGDVEAGRDLAQEAYVRAIRAWGRFDGTDVRAWLHTMGLRLAFNERDRRIRWRRLMGVDPPRSRTGIPEGRMMDWARGLARLGDTLAVAGHAIGLEGQGTASGSRGRGRCSGERV